mgnify:CR=1 FL=1
MHDSVKQTLVSVLTVKLLPKRAWVGRVGSFRYWTGNGLLLEDVLVEHRPQVVAK